MKQILCILLAFWAAACSPSKKSASDEAVAVDMTAYAQGFSVQHFDDYTSVEVHDPWNNNRLLQRYLLVDRNSELPANLPKGTVVRTPIQNVVVYTAVHTSIIDQLGEIDKVIGVCEPQYIETPAIHEGLKSGKVADLGMATSPNVEKIIEIGTEVIIASPFENSGYGPAEKLGIPIVEAADYMESLPLGRAEWIRFYGLLFGKGEVADSIFHETEKNYLALKLLTASVYHRPTVLSEKRFGASWYVPAGDSYVAHLYADAGADYIFKELPGAGSTPLAFESVFDRAIHADVWLMKYNQSTEMSYQELRTEYTPYENFDAFKNRRIYACNTGAVPYYEEFPMHPDWLLNDLIWIFHPELVPDYIPRYYKKMK